MTAAITATFSGKPSDKAALARPLGNPYTQPLI